MAPPAGVVAAARRRAQGRLRPVVASHLEAQKALPGAEPAVAGTAAGRIERRGPARSWSQAAQRPDWKALAVALERFQTEWRKLSRSSNTVCRTRSACWSSAWRCRAVSARVAAERSAPRRAASASGWSRAAPARWPPRFSAPASLGRDWIGRCVSCRAKWQHRATVLPLGRGAENALWSRFKAEIDTIQRPRRRSERARCRAQGLRCRAGGADRTPRGGGGRHAGGKIKRTLAEVDARWQRAADAARRCGRTDSRFAHPRQRAPSFETHAERSWNAICDALLAKLALCEGLERSRRQRGAAGAALWPRSPCCLPSGNSGAGLGALR